ncbi:MAG: hypothetical protein IKD79_02980 [Oscillospiraceae bacterium]|nr:hypothetical protein [Oscillospiraceae bacterium]
MAEKRLSHAYMLVGPEGAARQEAVLRLASALLCSEPEAPCGKCRDCRKAAAGIHPDMIFVDRKAGDKGQLHRELLVDQIRQITADAVIAPNEAARKVYIIREADRMNIAAQNALLKALEEPPGHACFLLCTAAADALLPTVRSRCVRIDDTLRSFSSAELSDLAREFLALSAAGDEPGMTLFCMLRTKFSREETEELLEELEDALCDIQCGRRPNPGLSWAQISRLSARMERAKDYLRRNVSPKQVFGALAAEALR